ncbi:MAG: hypothetical protein KAR38_15285 [Calditrichia bacterium]|nr:hypothetical protein [Calditrichia bacterium]
MANLLRVFIMGLFILLVSISCTRIEQQAAPEGELEYIVQSELNSIPLEYGKLKSITAHSMYDGWAQLWFEDEQQTIRMVRVNFHINKIHENVIIISRK